MIINFNKRRDDYQQNRLFSYLQSQLPFKILKTEFIRNQVIKITTKDAITILKGFPSLEHIKIQADLTSALKTEGFSQVPEFLSMNKPIFLDNEYYSFQEYIQPGLPAFNYKRKKDRQDGLHLLSKFHAASKPIVQEFSKKLPHTSLYRKWKERLIQFNHNLSIISGFIDQKFLIEICCWAEQALKGMERDQPNAEEQVILHGDVAHHNFIRHVSGGLYIIDFDLTAIGPERYDLLQYSNRILPFLGWSLKELSKLNTINSYTNDKEFLYALAYPADILREWNRLIRNGQQNNPQRVLYVTGLTMNQLNLRRSFVRTIFEKTET